MRLKLSFRISAVSSAAGFSGAALEEGVTAVGALVAETLAVGALVEGDCAWMRIAPARKRTGKIFQVQEDGFDMGTSVRSRNYNSFPFI
jgi:hypothetical protein